MRAPRGPNFHLSFSVTGKKMMAKCRSLIQENAELGKQISQVCHLLISPLISPHPLLLPSSPPPTPPLLPIPPLSLPSPPPYSSSFPPFSPFSPSSPPPLSPSPSSQGRVAQLEAEIALHKKFNQEIKNAQDGTTTTPRGEGGVV